MRCTVRHHADYVAPTVPSEMKALVPERVHPQIGEHSLGVAQQVAVARHPGGLWRYRLSGRNLHGPARDESELTRGEIQPCGSG